jgi:hypothetical protein
MSRVTLHRRGNTLDDYVVAALRRASDDLRTSLWPAMTGEGAAAERLRDALLTLCEVCERHAGVMSAVFGTRVRTLPDRRGHGWDPETAAGRVVELCSARFRRSGAG